MASSPASPSPEAEVTFARNLGLFDATMIGAGIFVLTGKLHALSAKRCRRCGDCHGFDINHL